MIRPLIKAIIDKFDNFLFKCAEKCHFKINNMYDCTP